MIARRFIFLACFAGLLANPALARDEPMVPGDTPAMPDPAEFPATSVTKQQIRARFARLGDMLLACPRDPATRFHTQTSPQVVGEAARSRVASAAANLAAPAKASERAVLELRRDGRYLANTFMSVALRAADSERLDDEKIGAQYTFLTYGIFNWYAQGFALSKAREAERKAWLTYTQAAETLYRRAPEAARAAMLDGERKRLDCLIEKRRETFAALGEMRLDAMGKAIANRNAYDNNAGNQLELMSLAARYRDLVAETNHQANIVRILAESHARAFLNAEVKRAEEVYFHSNPSADWRVAVDTARPARLKAAKARAIGYYALLATDEIGNEAAFTQAVHLGGGFDAAIAKIGGEGKTFIDGLIDSGQVQTSLFVQLDQANKTAVLLALGKKFLGTGLDTMIVAPMTDAFIENFGKPVASLFGVDAKTSMETAWTKFAEIQLSHIRRLKAVQNFTQHHSYDEALALARHLGGRPGGDAHPHVATRAKTTFAEMVSQHKLTASSEGGWAHVLEPVCEDLRDQAALWHGAMRQAHEGLTAEAYVLLSASRGQTVANPGRAVSDDMLAAYMSPKSDWFKNKYEVYFKGIESNPLIIFPGLMGATFEMILIDAPMTILSEGSQLSQRVKNFSGYAFGDFNSQDAYLQSLVQTQSRWDRYRDKLKAGDWNTLAVEQADIGAAKLAGLIAHSGQPFILARTRIAEAEITRSENRTPARTQTGRTNAFSLMALERAKQRRRYDKMADMAMADLRHAALTGQYMAASIAAKKFESVVNARFKFLGVQGTINLKREIDQLEAKAAFADSVDVYVALWKEAHEAIVIEAVVGLAAEAIASKITEAGVYTKTVTDAAQVARAAEVNAVQKLYEAFNPLAGKMSASGAYGLAKSSATKAVANTAAQIVAAKSDQLVSEQDAQKAFETVFSLVEDTVKQSGSKIEGGHAAWLGDKAYIGAVTRGLTVAGTTLDGALKGLDQMQTEAMLAIRTKSVEALKAANEALVTRAVTLAGTDEAKTHRAAMDEVEDAAERSRAREEEVRGAARAIALDHIDGEVSGALGGRKPSKAHADAAEQMRRTLTALEDGSADIATLKTLADPTHSMGLRDHLMTDALPIETIRKGLKAARMRAKADNDQSGLAEVNRIAEAIDDVRIGKINKILAEFMNSSAASGVEVIIQGGAAKGNPEYQGVLADIDFTLFTRPDLTTDQRAAIAKALYKKFEDAGVPLATEDSGNYSPMDSEAFVQPLMRFDSGNESTLSVTKDVILNKASPTRFYSEAGGKWFINNALYSGKVLAGRGTLGQWVKLKPSEGMGLALDMMRYMGFLTDPHYTRSTVSAMDAPAQQAVMGKALGKTKYFLRLLDAYLIAHPKGNEAYNARLGNRAETGEDASYHRQIYKELAALGGDADLLEPGDLKMIEQMSRMKMKGENPTPWDAMEGSGSDKVAQAHDMMAMMERLTAKIVARTSAVAMDDLEALKSSGDAAALQERMADSQRLLSTMANTLSLDSDLATVMMIPPADVTKRERGGWKIEPIDEAEHTRRLREAMRGSQIVRAGLEAQIAKALQDQPGDDPEGKAKTERVEAIKASLSLREMDVAEPYLGFFSQQTLDLMVAVRRASGGQDEEF